LVKQGQHAYKVEREKKRTFRKLWIERLSAVIREKGYSYSSFIGKMTAKNIQLDRKVLSNIAVAFPAVLIKYMLKLLNNCFEWLLSLKTYISLL
jgi:ribosomal protein L20